MAIHYPTLVSPTINPREWDAVVSFIQEYRLDIHEPGIIAQLQSINKENPRPIDLRSWGNVQKIYQRYLSYHKDKPFATAPKNLFPARIYHRHPEK